MASSNNPSKTGDAALRVQMMADIGLQRRIAITEAHDENDRVIQNVQQEEAALQRQRTTLAPSDPRAQHLAAWNNFKENDPHVDIEARMMPALTAGGVTHRLNRGGYLTTPETSAPIHDIGYPGRSEQPVRVFALGEAKNASRKRSYAAVELPSNNEIERPKKRRRNQKSNSSSGAPAPPAVAPRPARAASNSVSLLSDALANLSITQGGPTATQSIANPNNRLASPENFMAAIKSTIETKNPPAAATSAGVPVVPFPPATEKAFPLSSTKPKPAARREPDRGRHTFEGRLLGTQQSKYAPKNVPVDTDVTMTDGDDDVPVAPAASASDKPRTGLMASKWAPKKA